MKPKFTEMKPKFTEMKPKFTEMKSKFTDMNRNETEMNRNETEMNPTNYLNEPRRTPTDPNGNSGNSSLTTRKTKGKDTAKVTESSSVIPTECYCLWITVSYCCYTDF